MTSRTRTPTDSVFRLYFPAIQAEQPQASPRPEIEHLTAREQDTVLLVEDIDSLRSAGRRMIERAGFNVVEAADGCEGLEVYRRDPPRFDVIVSDTVMPRMSGVELLNSIRSDGDAVPFVITSGSLAELDDLGDDVVYLAKPWTVVDLLVSIRRALESSRREEVQRFLNPPAF